MIQKILIILIFINTLPLQSADLEKPTIAVFCGAYKTTPHVHATAYELGTYLGANAFGLITGGSASGLMKEVTDGYVSHAISLKQFWNVVLEPYKNEYHPKIYQENIIPMTSLHERINYFCAKTNICIVLPGGFGTLQELINCLMHKNNDKMMIILLNLDGFWNNIIQQFKIIVANNAAASKHLKSFIIVNTLNECIEILQNI